MKKPRTAYDRRAFLRGAGGLILTLPMLEMTHGKAWAQGSSGTPKRFILVFRHGGTASNAARYQVGVAGRKYDGTGNGHGGNLWNPTDPSSNLVLGPIHSILEAYKSKLIVVSGVDNAVGLLQSPNMGAHGWSNSTCLTAATVGTGTNAAGKEYVYSQGPSIDDVIATRLQAQTPRPFAAVRTHVYGHQYGSPFYAGPNQGSGSYSNPAQAFDAYLAGVGTGPPNPEVVRRRAMGLSVLDGVTDGYRRLEPKLSAQDRQVVDAHLTHLSELQARIKAYETLTCSPPAIDRAIKDADAEHVGPIMVDILLAALKCGLTQVATLNLADIITTWLPQAWGGLDVGHTLDHLARDVGPTGQYPTMQKRWFDEILVNRQWCMGLFLRLLKGLDGVPEGSGTMLDNSLMLYTSEFSNASVHCLNDVPILLAGSAGGYFTTGRHVNCNVANTTVDKFAYQSRTGTHNLYTSILNAFGFPDTHFGANLPGLVFKGPLPGLK